MATRWGEEQVLALAPDASAAAAGQKVARGDAAWDDTGAGSDGQALWGRCAGSGSSAYRVVVDLSGPAFRCSCPSRKFPCKHALGLLLRWARGTVPDGEHLPDDVASWLGSRAERVVATTRPTPTPGDPDAASRRTARREERVTAGLDELVRWLHDQLRVGLAVARSEGRAESARVAARLVDAQAPGAAGMVRELPWHSGDDGWPDRVLAEMARLALLVAADRAHRAAGPARAADPATGTADPTTRTAGPPTRPVEVSADVVRGRVGWSTPSESVLAQPAVPDRWLVLWQVDEPDGRLVTRRAHVHGTTTGTDLYVLAWGAAGQPPDTGLAPGTVLDADLHVHPGRPLRGVVGERRGPAGVPDGDHPRGTDVAGALRVLAAALARDPWVREAPVVLAGVRPARRAGGWAVLDPDGAVLPLVGPDAPLEWLAVSGGRRGDVAGELSRDGFRLRAVLERGGGPA